MTTDQNVLKNQNKLLQELESKLNAISKQLENLQKKLT
ncbi:DUF5320 domain-containing protein [Desulfosporosinus sp. OT]|nr:DUF5320 domain-containing protein [Desulfosporosinus sp. OT]EGW40169.1 hypothetical protein DOT_1810 [Desulfosporosinus sp. OT]